MQLVSRDVEILSWLVHMKFMLLDQIGFVFFKDCNPKRACYRRILKLMKGGFIAKKKVYTEAKDIYIPTKQAVAVLHDERVTFPLNISKDKAFANYGHDKGLIDIRILFQKLGVQTWIPERVLRSFKPRGFCPDALLLNQSATYAIEYERTEKRLSRYRDIFKRYEESNQFDAVLYICPNESFIARVRKKHNPSRRFYFIAFETLFTEKEHATFFSHSDGLPMTHFIQDSTKRVLNDVKPEFLKELFKSKDPEAWKRRKPYVKVPTARDRDDDHDDYASHYNGEEESDPNLDPNYNSPDDDEEV